ncbi:MAG: hypothetical protein QM489_00020 [Candidatus Izemoplasma sp.]
MQGTFNKRLFNIREFIDILNKSTHSIVKYKKEMKLISSTFETHIMLAVTEVNGCMLCSYYHTKQALESGISVEELSMFLTGDLATTNKEEVIAVLFAQHYASEHGNFDKDIFKNVIKEYGSDIAYGILGKITLIMMGNAYGIAYGCLKDRIKGKRVKGSKFINELMILLGIVPLLPVLLIKNLFSKKHKF